MQPDAAHPLAPEMQLYPPKNKSSTGGLGEGFVPHRYSQNLSTESSSEAQGGQVIIAAAGWSQASGVSAVVAAPDVATTGHQTAAPLGQLQLGLGSLNQHPWGRRDPSADEFAGGPGNGSTSRERPPAPRCALGLFAT